MLNSAGANLIEDKEASFSNLRLTLASWKTSLLGDPYFGTNIKRYIYEQNNTVLKDLIIDDIYLSIQEFMPQIFVERKDIVIEQKYGEVYTKISCINTLDNQPYLYDIKLTEDSLQGGSKL